MNPFEYRRVDTAPQAAARLAQNRHATVVAGGTGLIDLMKLGVESPDEVVDISRLPLTDVGLLGDGTLRIGAMVRNSDLARHPLVMERFPALSQALLAGASPQLRNAATVGGNLMQRTRCPYFRDLASACNKRQPESGCSAIHGHHRMHAILGTSPSCFATHPSDMCVALVAFEAVIELTGPDGTRTVPITQFHHLPGDTPQHETVLERGEIVTAVELPPTPFASHSAYLKVRDRASYEFALASVAAALDVQNGVVQAARIGLGGVATRPWRAEETEALLVGHKPDLPHLRAAAAAAVVNAHPRRDNGYKVELIQRLVVRVLEQLTAGRSR